MFTAATFQSFLALTNVFSGEPKRISSLQAALARVACVLVMFLGLVSTADAQYIPPKAYCVSNTGKCYESFDHAEAALLAASPYGSLIRRKSTSLNVSSSRGTIEYEVPNQPPSLFHNPVFRVPKVSGTADVPCLRSDPRHGQVYGDGCDDLGAAIQAWMDSTGYGTPGSSCSFTGPPEVRGRPYDVNAYRYYEAHSQWGDFHYMQVQGSGVGVDDANYQFLDLDQYRVVVPVQCSYNGNLNVAFASIDMHQAFECPSYFQAVAYATRTQADVRKEPLCKPSNSVPSISIVLKQVASCPANAHPCHPATGDKSRSEVDFQFGGRPFVRYYHSLKEQANSGFGVGWTHTYSESIYELSQNFYLIGADGTYEAIKLISGSLYRPENSKDRLVERLATGDVRYKMTDASGEVREFNAQGRLAAIRNPANPQLNITLSYSGTLLTKVADAAGRAISFVYNDGLIEGIGLPDGALRAYAYDASRNLIAADVGGGQLKQYHYAESDLSLPLFKNHLTGITSEDGQRFASFAYDAYGRVISSSLHADGSFVDRTTLAYTTASTVSVTTSTQEVKGYTIQPGVYRRVLSISDAGGVTNATYHPDGRVATLTDAKGGVTSYEYPTPTTAAETRAVGTTIQTRTEVDRSAATNLVVERRTYDAVGTLVRREVWTHNSRGQILTHSVID